MMKTKWALLGAVFGTVFASPAHGQTALDREIRASQFLVGSWECADTVGNQVGAYTLTVTRALDERWLRQKYEWHGSNGAKPLRGEYFLGYDPRVQKWIRIGAMNDGMYFAMVGIRNGKDWTYSYALPGPGKTVYTRKSDTEYTVLGPTYKENGIMVTEHHGCHKAR